MPLNDVLTLRTSPSTLTNVKATANSPAVCLACFGIHEPLLCLDDCAGLSLVIDTKHLTPDLKLATLAGRRNRLQEFELALAVENMLGIELGHTSDWLSVRASVEVDYFLIGVLERQDDGVCGESCKLGMQFLQHLLARALHGLSYCVIFT
jgi:hypothetical protein